MRFSHVSGSAFSNTVLSLSPLTPVDHQPAVVCIVGPAGLRFMLMNATFLRKVSHSSHELRADNVRGSFNGSDVVSNYAGLNNEPANSRELFAMHEVFSWQENLERLVEATNDIVGRKERFQPDDGQVRMILGAPARSAQALADGSPRRPRARAR